ncbi:MAG: hypothetical protein PVH95_08910, partial [Anaerolineae bacterium]
MTDFYLNERIMEHRVAEAHRQAELERQKKEATAGRENWLSQQRYQLVSWLGCRLMSSGRRLLQSISQSAPGAEG